MDVTEAQKRVMQLLSQGGKKGITFEHVKPVFFEDGRVVMVQPDGGSVTLHPDGKVVHTSADGSERIIDEAELTS